MLVATKLMRFKIKSIGKNHSFEYTNFYSFVLFLLRMNLPLLLQMTKSRMLVVTILVRLKIVSTNKMKIEKKDCFFSKLFFFFKFSNVFNHIYLDSNFAYPLQKTSNVGTIQQSRQLNFLNQSE